MKKILLGLLIVSNLAFGASFVNPNNFKGTKSEKTAVVAWIKQEVKEKYTAIGMGDATTLRMMEKNELKAFKELTEVKDKKLLSKVMEKYKSIGMNDYNTFMLMYNQEEKASKEELNW